MCGCVILQPGQSKHQRNSPKDAFEILTIKYIVRVYLETHIFKIIRGHGQNRQFQNQSF